MKVSDGGGVEHEEENIEVLEMSMDDALQIVGLGEIKDAKTVVLLQYVRLKGVL